LVGLAALGSSHANVDDTTGRGHRRGRPHGWRLRRRQIPSRSDHVTSVGHTLGGGAAGEDAATQAIADLRSTTINWTPGADLRSLLGAAPRGGTAMNDVPPAIQAFQTAYDDLKAATGFECR
jgi:hypothetical protein